MCSLFQVGLWIYVLNHLMFFFFFYLIMFVLFLWTGTTFLSCLKDCFWHFFVFIADHFVFLNFTVLYTQTKMCVAAVLTWTSEMDFQLVYISDAVWQKNIYTSIYVCVQGKKDFKFVFFFSFFVCDEWFINMAIFFMSVQH